MGVGPVPNPILPGTEAAYHLARETDDSRIDLAQRIGPEAHSLSGSCPIVLDQYIGIGNQPSDQLPTFFQFQVNAETLLAATRRGKGWIHVATHDHPNKVGCAAALDLDDLSSVLGQQSCRLNAHRTHSKIDHPQAPQRVSIDHTRGFGSEDLFKFGSVFTSGKPGLPGFPQIGRSRFRPDSLALAGQETRRQHRIEPAAHLKLHKGLSANSVLVLHHFPGMQERRRGNPPTLGFPGNVHLVLIQKEALENGHDLIHGYQAVDELVVVGIHQLFGFTHPFEQCPPMPEHQNNHPYVAISAAVEGVYARTRPHTDGGIQRKIGQRPVGQVGHRLHGGDIHVLTAPGLQPFPKCQQGSKGR